MKLGLVYGLGSGVARLNPYKKYYQWLKLDCPADLTNYGTGGSPAVDATYVSGSMAGKDLVIRQPSGDLSLYQLSETYGLGWYGIDENDPLDITYATLKSYKVLPDNSEDIARVQSVLGSVVNVSTDWFVGDSIASKNVQILNSTKLLSNGTDNRFTSNRFVRGDEDFVLEYEGVIDVSLAALNYIFCAGSGNTANNGLAVYMSSARKIIVQTTSGGVLRAFDTGFTYTLGTNLKFTLNYYASAMPTISINEGAPINITTYTNWTGNSKFEAFIHSFSTDVFRVQGELKKVKLTQNPFTSFEYYGLETTSNVLIDYSGNGNHGEILGTLSGARSTGHDDIEPLPISNGCRSWKKIDADEYLIVGNISNGLEYGFLENYFPVGTANVGEVIKGLSQQYLWPVDATLSTFSDTYSLGLYATGVPQTQTYEDLLALKRNSRIKINSDDNVFTEFALLNADKKDLFDYNQIFSNKFHDCGETIVLRDESFNHDPLTVKNSNCLKLSGSNSISETTETSAFINNTYSIYFEFETGFIPNSIITPGQIDVQLFRLLQNDLSYLNYLVLESNGGTLGLNTNTVGGTPAGYHIDNLELDKRMKVLMTWDNSTPGTIKITYQLNDVFQVQEIADDIDLQTTVKLQIGGGSNDPLTDTKILTFYYFGGTVKTYQEILNGDLSGMTIGYTFSEHDSNPVSVIHYDIGSNSIDINSGNTVVSKTDKSYHNLKRGFNLNSGVRIPASFTNANIDVLGNSIIYKGESGITDSENTYDGLQIIGEETGATFSSISAVDNDTKITIVKNDKVITSIKLNALDIIPKEDFFINNSEECFKNMVSNDPT